MLYLPQIVQHVFDILITLVEFFAQGFVNDKKQLVRQIRREGLQRRRFLLNDRQQNIGRRRARKRQPPRQKLVKRRAEAPDVGSRVNLKTARLLRRHINDRAFDRAANAVKQRVVFRADNSRFAQFR